MTQRAVLYSGGYSHPFDESGSAWKAQAEAVGWNVEQTPTLNAAVKALDGAQLFMINALLWSMTQHEKYAPDRAAYAYELSDSHMDRIEEFVHGGGSLFALHTSTICFDTQPRWKQLLGGGWTWDHSFHPPFGEITVCPTGVLGLEPQSFTITDEAYHNLDPVEEANILATCTLDDGPQPIAWVMQQGAGKVGVNALGHDGASLKAPGHKALNTAILEWLQ